MLTYFFRLRALTPPFSTYSELEKMLALRKLGYSYTILADEFSVDKTTIRYICRRFGLSGSVPVIVIRQSPRTTSSPKKQQHNEKNETLNQGKMYAEYLQEEKERKWRRLTQTRSK